MARVDIATPDGTVGYESATGERLLYAGLRQGLDMPYECGSGTCGKCRAILLEGDVADLWPAAPARQMLKHSRNEILLCQTAATSDVRIRFLRAPARGGASPVPQQIDATVGIIRPLTSDVIELDVALDRSMTFDAGQFVLLQAPGVRGYRGYSIVNWDRPATSLVLLMKRKPGGGVSEWLFNRPVSGERVRLFGPVGKATFDPLAMADIVCIAGGSGIAGMMSIIRSMLAQGHLEERRADFFFGVRRAADLFYADELCGFRRRAPDHLQVTIAFSEDAVSTETAATFPELEFSSGLVHKVALRKLAGRLSNTTAFLAGPPVAVDAGIRSLVSVAKMPLSRIRFDRFA